MNMLDRVDQGDTKRRRHCVVCVWVGGGGGGAFGTFYTTNSIRISECQVESKIISSLHA